MKKMYPGMHSDEQLTNTPDVNVLPSSGGESLEKSGIKNTGYLTKKGTDSGLEARFNYLPPGMNIEDQDCADIRGQELKNYSGGLGYPGDGWQ